MKQIIGFDGAIIKEAVITETPVAMIEEKKAQLAQAKADAIANQEAIVALEAEVAELEIKLANAQAMFPQPTLEPMPEEVI